MVRLKVEIQEHCPLLDAFQFQYGAIKGEKIETKGFLDTSFNSSMVRLRALYEML